MDHQEFLTAVKIYVKKHPDVAPLVTQFVSQGLAESLRARQEQLADFETALVALAAVRFKDRDAVLQRVLTKWEGQTNFKWDWLLEKLEPSPKPPAEEPAKEPAKEPLVQVIGDLVRHGYYAEVNRTLTELNLLSMDAQTLNDLLAITQPVSEHLPVFQLLVRDVEAELKRQASAGTVKQ